MRANTFAQQGDTDHIFIGLCWQTDHEIEFDRLPFLVECLADRLQNRLVQDGLVDRPSQTLRARLGCECESAASDSFQRARDLLRETVQAQRGQCDGDAILHMLVDDALRQCFDLCIVSARERHQRHLVVARRVEPVRGLFENLVHVPFPHRPVGEARLAKPAPARAAAHDLYRDALMHPTAVRCDLFGWVETRFEIDGSFPHHSGNIRLDGIAEAETAETVRRLRIEPRDEQARHAGQFRKQRLARFARLFRLGDRLADFENHVFAFTDREDIDERRHGCGVIRTRSSRDHQRVILVSHFAS